MRRIVRLSTVLASLSFLAAASPQVSPQTDIPDTGFHLKVAADWVYVNASVRDYRDRSSRPGLGKDDFLVFEDEVLQRVGSCVPAETPFNLLLLLDVSASTAPFVRVLRDSVSTFARLLKPADRIALMTFSSRSRLILPPTNDRARVKAAVRFVAQDGATLFYDGLMSAFRTFRDVAGRKAVIVFSDGVDNQLLNPNDGSETRFADLLDAARRSDCLVYNIFLPPASEAEARHPAVMKAEQQMHILSSETGGKMYRLEKAEDLPAHYAEIALDLRFIYTLAYAPDPSTPAGWRRLRVEVKGHPEYSVRARSGYFKSEESEVRSQEAE